MSEYHKKTFIPDYVAREREEAERVRRDVTHVLDRALEGYGAEQEAVIHRFREILMDNCEAGNSFLIAQRMRDVFGRFLDRPYVFCLDNHENRFLHFLQETLLAMNERELNEVKRLLVAVVEKKYFTPYRQNNQRNWATMLDEALTTHAPIEVLDDLPQDADVLEDRYQWARNTLALENTIAALKGQTWHTLGETRRLLAPYAADAYASAEVLGRGWEIWRKFYSENYLNKLTMLRDEGYKIDQLAFVEGNILDILNAILCVRTLDFRSGPPLTFPQLFLGFDRDNVPFSELVQTIESVIRRDLPQALQENKDMQHRIQETLTSFFDMFLSYAPEADRPRYAQRLRRALKGEPADEPLRRDILDRIHARNYFYLIDRARADVLNRPLFDDGEVQQTLAQALAREAGWGNFSVITQTLRACYGDDWTVYLQEHQHILAEAQQYLQRELLLILDPSKKGKVSDRDVRHVQGLIASAKLLHINWRDIERMVGKRIRVE